MERVKIVEEQAIFFLMIENWLSCHIIQQGEAAEIELQHWQLQSRVNGIPNTLLNIPYNLEKVLATLHEKLQKKSRRVSTISPTLSNIIASTCPAPHTTADLRNYATDLCDAIDLHPFADDLIALSNPVLAEI